MVGICPFGARPIFRGELLVSGSLKSNSQGPLHQSRACGEVYCHRADEGEQMKVSSGQLTVLVYVHSLKLTYPLKIGHPKIKLVFQPSIFRCYVSYWGPA